MIPDWLLTHAREFLLDLAPELQGEPLYVLTLPQDYPRPSCTAFATHGTDHAIRQHLIDRGLWRGPGATIAVVNEQLDLESLTGLLLHELAHLLPFVPVVRHDHEPEQHEIDHKRELIAAWASEPATDPRRCPQHGPAFVRTCCHLAHRAAAAGVSIPFPAIVTGWHYALPPLVRFARALGDEPANLARESFATITNTPSPESFLQLFQD